MASIPEAIQKDQPKQTLEMPGPGGDAQRKATFNSQLSDDRAAARSASIEKIADRKAAFEVSKEHVREGTHGKLAPEFERSR
jgi:hypothetical protein